MEVKLCQWSSGTGFISIGKDCMSILKDNLGWIPQNRKANIKGTILEVKFDIKNERIILTSKNEHKSKKPEA